MKLKFVLKRGVKIIVLNNNESLHDIKLFSKKELSNRLYVYDSFEKDGRLNFSFHLEARDRKDIKEKYVESEIDFDNSKPSLRFTYSKYNLLVENFNFRINMDGHIVWI